MSICLFVPSNPTEICWSSLSNIWFQKFGVLHDCIRVAPKEKLAFSDSCYNIVASPCSLNPFDTFSSGYYEGPFSLEMSRCLLFSVVTHTLKEINIEFEHHSLSLGPGYFSNNVFGRPIDSVRRIPTDRAEISTPYVLKSQLDTAIDIQTFKECEDWHVLARICIDGDDNKKLPVVVTNGRIILSGIPFLDLVVEKMSMPHCTDGYYEPVQHCISHQMESWLGQLLISSAVNGGFHVAQINHWPGDYMAVFTIRHDYDRPVPEEEIERLLRDYEEKGLKCSIGFLIRLIPSINLIERLKKLGHEIVLHSEASDEESFISEVDALSEKIGKCIDGVTCHGGIGSVGHLGDILFKWCEGNELLYTEQLGRDGIFPHPAIVLEKNGIIKLKCMVMSSHLSLDSGTAPHAHCYYNVKERVNRRIFALGVANIMNHPDIHFQQLEQLTQDFDLERVWCATHSSIAKWCKLTKYDIKIEWTDNHKKFKIFFSEELPFPLKINIVSIKGNSVIEIPQGKRTYHGILPAPKKGNQ